MTTKLTLYNGALLQCGERFLHSSTGLTENREARYLLDQVWDSNGVKSCLEEGQWYFAMRTVQIDYDPSIEPDFGYRRAFAKPSDWLLTSSLCSDEFFNVPVTRYTDESGYWYADLDSLYVRFVSNDTDYGQDMNKWPEKFREFVEVHFASRIIRKLTSSTEKEEALLKLRERVLAEARSRSAMAEPTRFPAQGSWSTSRRGRSSRRDLGPRGNLIG